MLLNDPKWKFLEADALDDLDLHKSQQPACLYSQWAAQVLLVKHIAIKVQGYRAMDQGTR